MMTKQKLSKLILAVLVVPFLSGFFSIALFNNATVQAWCNNSESWDKGQQPKDCYYGNMSEVQKLPADKKVTNDVYESYVFSCMENGGSDAGACSNAALSCLQRSMDTSACSNGAYTGAIADDCNAGRLITNGGCDPIAKANNDTITQYENETIGKVSCTGSNTSAEAKKRCDDALSKVKTQCAKASGLYVNPTTGERDPPYSMGGGNGGNSSYVKGVDKGDYQNCLKEQMIKEISDDQQVCDAVGGKWVDKDYPDPVAGSNNNVSKGCKNNFTDITNENACKAAGGEWYQSGGADTSKPQDDAYGCKDPNGTDEDPNNDGTKDGPTAGVGGNKPSGSTKRCGPNAKVNLLECGNEGGATALGNVLRIFVIVLSFGVGVAAVGGLAYSAIQYAGASDNQSSVSAARERIRNIVIGLLLFGFLIAITNWLVPGGVL